MEQWVLDCEVYPNFTLVAMQNIRNRELFTLDVVGQYGVRTKAQREELEHILSNNITIGFNSISYDMPIIGALLAGMNCYEIYEMSKDIIENGLKYWETYRNYEVRSYVSDYDHIDIKELALGQASLKMYGARINSHKLQDLPIDPHKETTASERYTLTRYCENDLKTTIDLYEKLKPNIKLRVEMSNKYGIDLRSKSDAQIAEKVIINELALKRKPIIPQYSEDVCFKYKKPNSIIFLDKNLKDIVNMIESLEFKLNKRKSIQLPKELTDLKINIGQTFYKIGVGGLHSVEKNMIYKSNDDYQLIDKDVASYYPSIIINNNLYPQQLGVKFMDVYKKIVNERLKAKAEKDKVKADSLKIVINGSYGKFGSQYSQLYSPQLLLNTTLTGQLALLMLISSIERAGISVISANTDGIVSYVPRDKLAEFENKCSIWEKKTKFKLEGTKYRELYSRDVNNYIAITSDGKMKAKGIYGEPSLSKNLETPVIFEAIKDMYLNNKPIEEHILAEKDITKFLAIRRVTGGAVWKNEPLGKVVRWYYSTEGDIITYAKNGNKVPKTDGARPLMDLVDMNDIKDLDYGRYIEEAQKHII